MTKTSHVSRPPAGEVPWTVTRRVGGEKLGTVVAQTWYQARTKAVTAFHVSAADIYIVLQNGDRP